MTFKVGPDVPNQDPDWQNFVIKESFEAYTPFSIDFAADVDAQWLQEYNNGKAAASQITDADSLVAQVYATALAPISHVVGRSVNQVVLDEFLERRPSFGSTAPFNEQASAGEGFGFSRDRVFKWGDNELLRLRQTLAYRDVNGTFTLFEDTAVI